MAKRKSSRVSLPSVTQPRGLLSTRRRTSKRPAIAKDLADDKRAGPAVFHDQGGHLARHASLVWARAPASRSLAEQGDLVRRGMRAAVLRRNHSGPFLIILEGHGLRFPQAFARRPARPRRTNHHSAVLPAMPRPITAFRDHCSSRSSGSALWVPSLAVRFRGGNGGNAMNVRTNYRVRTAYRDVRLVVILAALSPIVMISTALNYLSRLVGGKSCLA